MPLPTNAFVIHGGCNCGAIRYRVSVPELAHRPLRCTPAAGAETFERQDGGAEIRLPMVFMDHCNDCRRASGGFLVAWVSVDIRTAEFGFRSAGLPGAKSSSLTEDGDDGGLRGEARGQGEDEKDRDWVSATTVFASAPLPPPSSSLLSLTTGENGDGEFSAATATADTDMAKENSKTTHLKIYSSSPNIRRGFCAHCGTNLTFHDHHTPAGFTEMLDLVLGSVDKDDLEGLEAERHFFWDSGIGWIKRMVADARASDEDGGGGHGAQLPKHPAASAGSFA